MASQTKKVSIAFLVPLLFIALIPLCQTLDVSTVDAETLSTTLTHNIAESSSKKHLKVGRNDHNLVPMDRAGNCYCGPSKQFHQRYNKAYVAVRAVVVGKEIISGENSVTEYVEYKFRSQTRFKGPKSLRSGKIFHVRAWSNPDFCGLTFHRYVKYFMFLPNPWFSSIVRNKGSTVYAADQCSKAYIWHGLSDGNKQFLWAKRRQIQ